MKSISAAWVVVLPEPVGPVTKDKATAQIGEFLDHHWNTQLLDTRNLVGIKPKSCTVTI